MTGMGRAPEDVQVSPMRIWDAAAHYILAPTRRVETWQYRCCPASPSPQRDIQAGCTVAKTILCTAMDMIIELVQAFRWSWAARDSNWGADAKRVDHVPSRFSNITRLELASLGWVTLHYAASNQVLLLPYNPSVYQWEVYQRLLNS